VGAGLFLGVQVAVGQNSVAASYALPAFTACFLGGAALTGGRGSFVGAFLGALFLTLLINVTPLLSLPTAVAQTATGVLTILAVVAYTLPSSNRTVSLKWRARSAAAPPNTAVAASSGGEPGTTEADATTREPS
jgi:ribose/xylose/arabinose/galactoside ABC-type transport system permease subunit